MHSRSQNRRGSLRFLPPLEMRPSSIAPNPAESREAPPTPQHPSPLRGTLRSSFRSPQKPREMRAEPGLSNTYKAQGSETGVIPICPFPPSPRWGEKRTTQTVVIIGTKEGCLGRIREGFPKRRCCCGSLCPQAGHLPQEECMCGWRLVVVWAGGVKQKPADPLEDFKDCT